MPLSAELERALAGLLNPLRFACENDFTALPRLGSIESMLCRNARHIQTTHSDPQVCAAAALLEVLDGEVPQEQFRALSATLGRSSGD